jgi:hypothetical protein
MARTTERRRPSSKGTTDAGNLKLYLIALLAAAYVGAWYLLGLPPPAKSEEEAQPLKTALQTSPEHGMAIWFHDLPAADRPVVHLPAGWHVADRTLSRTSATAGRVPVPERVSPARTRRIRTRSS